MRYLYQKNKKSTVGICKIKLSVVLTLSALGWGAQTQAETIPAGYPPRGATTIGTVEAKCLPSPVTADDRKVTAHLIGCFLEEVSGIDTDSLKTVSDVKNAYGDLVSDKYLEDWSANGHVTIGTSHGYKIMRFEGLTYSRNLYAFDNLVIYGYLISENGKDKIRDFYSLSFSGISKDRNLILSSVRDKNALIKTYSQDSLSTVERQ
ncbi:hypothetical protein [Asticcacaulis benevestitus]|uniref:Uncharacterized protein n=1 Tax=Asticcacaulis benevestitus DSM 16100 = ATCC BAA-896 TaxID=1121022 RepID=V4P7P0_9CAUL|nr:hypothetical protein [Asticcacaulis benevestitus]ESQ89967.1 hypothetical protein ABENE_13255 [Asticcacaulis benevestitus DSM 16100 = ATCC BAA-896]